MAANKESYKMSKSAMNLQDSFLNQVRRENTEVNVLLVNGTALRGFVKGFDNFTVIMNNRDGQHLLYKHAIAQLVSKRPANLKQHGDEAGAENSEIGLDAPAVAAAPRTPRPQGTDKNQKPRKEAFNKLDLSQVQLSEPQR
jgi:host factor-I protein